MRSFTLITIAFALILWACQTKKPLSPKGRMYIMPLAICAIVLFDMTSAGKRYLNKDHFITPKDFSAAYAPRPVDRLIHEDKDPEYRVLDISVNTFNDAIQSYHHKCIGGYSPVKLQRYQDLIDRYLSKETGSIYAVAGKASTIQEIEDGLPELKAVSMLNGKYIILGADLPPVRNHKAFGNCWFVSDAVRAETPDDEIALLGSTDLRTTAVIGDDFSWAREAIVNSNVLSETDAKPACQSIILESYAPNELQYKFRTDYPAAVIFSEIYYPKGWKAWIEPAGTYGKVKDGRYVPTDEAVPAGIFRADWLLRGIILPAGEGRIVMRFEPESYIVGANVSRASSAILLLLLILGSGGAVISGFARKK